MQVWLYKRTYDKKYASPDLGSHITINNVVFREEATLDIVNPVVKVLLNDPENVDINVINDFNGYNYMYIQQLKSYYWIEWHAEGGILVIKGRRDPLKTFWTDIKNSTQYVTRQQYKQNQMIVDNRLPMHSDNVYDTFVLDDNPAFDKHCTHLILETVGNGNKGVD